MTTISVNLLGGFVVNQGGEALDMPSDACRVIAFLALQRTRVSRMFVAGELWIESDQTRAFGNLRSALWRIRQRSDALVWSEGDSLGLVPGVEVDVERADQTATAIFAGDGALDSPDLSIEPFVGELLPGWYEDWALIERERIRQQALHALEAIATRLTKMGRYPEAITAALSAIKMDPFRESAHRCLMRIYLNEGNPIEALRQYERYKALLSEDLALDPTPKMLALVKDLGADGTASSRWETSAVRF